MKLFCVVSDLVPDPGVGLGDLRKPVLSLPGFMDEAWVAGNVSMTPAARRVMGVWASEVERETGAPVTAFEWPAGPKPAEFLEMMRYPLFVRSVATRCSMADPDRMMSNSSLFAKPVRAFMSAMAAHADRAGAPAPPSAYMNAILVHGSADQVRALAEFVGCFSMLCPVPGLDVLRKGRSGGFGDVLAFADDVGALLAAVDRTGRPGRPETDAASLFEAFASLVPHRDEANPYRLPSGDVDQWAKEMPFEEWLSGMDALVPLLDAIGPEILGDSGFDWSKAAAEGGVAHAARLALAYPMALPSLVTRISLLLPAEFPSWRAVLGAATLPCQQVAERGGKEGESVQEAAIRLYGNCGAGDRAALYDGLMADALVQPNESTVAFLRDNAHPSRRLGQGPSVAASRRLDSMTVPSGRPQVRRAGGSKGNSGTSEMAVAASPLLN